MNKLDSLISKFLKIKNKKFVWFRKGESLANISGMINGQTDVILTIQGRGQGNLLYPGLYKNFDNFDEIWASELARTKVFCDIATGFEGDHFFKIDKRLNEIDFGADEGKNYDLLPEEDKNRIDSFDYQAPGGECWADVKTRAIEFMGEQEENSSHLIFSHGGTICSLTYELGLKDIITCASCVGIVTDDEGNPEEINFEWEFPLELMS